MVECMPYALAVSRLSEIATADKSLEGKRLTKFLKHDGPDRLDRWLDWKFWSRMLKKVSKDGTTHPLRTCLASGSQSSIDVSGRL
jgi:hypothetical protein